MNFIKDHNNQIFDHQETSSSSCVWLDGHEVMKIFKINDRTLMRWRKKGTIPFSGSRGNYLYKKTDIDVLLNKRHYV